MYKVSKNTKIITIYLQKVGSLLLKFTMHLLLILFELKVVKSIMIQRNLAIFIHTEPVCIAMRFAPFLWSWIGQGYWPVRIRAGEGIKDLGKTPPRTFYHGSLIIWLSNICYLMQDLIFATEARPDLIFWCSHPAHLSFHKTYRWTCGRPYYKRVMGISKLVPS